MVSDRIRSKTVEAWNYSTESRPNPAGYWEVKWAKYIPYDHYELWWRLKSRPDTYWNFSDWDPEYSCKWYGWGDPTCSSCFFEGQPLGSLFIAILQETETTATYYYHTAHIEDPLSREKFETGKETNEWCKIIWNGINPGGKLIVGMNCSPGNHYNNKGSMRVEMRLMVDNKKNRKNFFRSKSFKYNDKPKKIEKTKFT